MISLILQYISLINSVGNACDCVFLDDGKIMVDNGDIGYPCEFEVKTNLHYKENTNKTKKTSDSKEDNIVFEPLNTGIKQLDLLNPLVKHGINLILMPKDSVYQAQYDLDKLLDKIYQNWIQNKQHHLIIADMFGSKEDAHSLRLNLKQNADESVSITVMCSDQNSNDWHRINMARCASTVAYNDENRHNTMVVYPRGNLLNKCITNMNEDIGCKDLNEYYDGDTFRVKWNSVTKHPPKEAPSYESMYSILKDLRDGPTYIFCLEIDKHELEDLNLKTSAYFTWADSVTILSPESNEYYPYIDTSKSVTNIFADKSSLNDREYNILYGYKRLFNDALSINIIKESTKYAQMESNRFDIKNIKLVSDTFDTIQNYIHNDTIQYSEYTTLLAHVEPLLMDKRDFSGNSLLEIFDNNPDISKPDMNIVFDFISQYITQESWLNEFSNYFVNNTSIMHPTLEFRSKFDDTGFLKNHKLNIQVKLKYNDKAIDLGYNVLVRVNGKIFTPLKSILTDIKKNTTGFDTNDNKFITTFEEFKESLSTPLQEYGLDIELRSKKASKFQCELVMIRGISKEHIWDITVFAFGYDKYKSKYWCIKKSVNSNETPHKALNTPKSRNTINDLEIEKQIQCILNTKPFNIDDSIQIKMDNDTINDDINDDINIQNTNDDVIEYSKFLSSNLFDEVNTSSNNRYPNKIKKKIKRKALVNLIE